MSGSGQVEHRASFRRNNTIGYTARRSGFESKERSNTMFMGYNGLWGLLVLAADIWAIINILQSSETNGMKLLWILVVVLLPVIGLILWYFIGPRDRTA
jgi:uncharacterized membrane protein